MVTAYLSARMTRWKTITTIYPGMAGNIRSTRRKLLPKRPILRIQQHMPTFIRCQTGDIADGKRAVKHSLGRRMKTVEINTTGRGNQYAAMLHNLAQPIPEICRRNNDRIRTPQYPSG